MGGSISDRRLEEIKACYDEFGIEGAAKKLNLSTLTIESYLIKWKSRNGLTSQKYNGHINRKEKFNEFEFTEQDGGAFLSGQATCLEELLEFSKVDLDIWEVENYEIKQNSWDVHMRNKDNDLSWKDGVVIKYLRTLMFNDEWEAKKGYISQKGAHMFVWNMENGNTHEFKYNRYE